MDFNISEAVNGTPLSFSIVKSLKASSVLSVETYMNTVLFNKNPAKPLHKTYKKL